MKFLETNLGKQTFENLECSKDLDWSFEFAGGTPLYDEFRQLAAMKKRPIFDVKDIIRSMIFVNSIDNIKNAFEAIKAQEA